MLRIGAVLVGMTLAAATAAAQEPPAREGDTVSFELKSSIIFVEGKINGQGPFTFIFDTGASVTVLRPQTAAKLGLVSDKGAGSGWGGWLMGLLKGAQVARLDSIGLGKAVLKDLPVAVMVVPQADVPLNMMGISYDGIIGYNFISQFVTTLDYSKKTIRLAPNAYVPEDPLGALKGAPRNGKAPEPAPAPEPLPAVSVGFTYRTVPDDMANEIGVEGGVEVRSVAPGSPAQKGGLRAGDIIREINEKRVDTARDYRRILSAVAPGDVVSFSVIRDRKDIQVKVTAAARP